MGLSQNIRHHNAMCSDELVFDDIHDKLILAHCTATSNVLTVTDENHKRCKTVFETPGRPIVYDDPS